MTRAMAVDAPRPMARAGWNTLQLLKVSRTALLLLDAVLLSLLLTTVHLHQRTVRTVGRDTVPSIIAAQHIRAAIAGMDAEVAQELLAGPDTLIQPLSNYDVDREEATASLVTAAENITFGEAERGPIRTLQNGLAVYENLSQHAFDLHDPALAGHADPGAMVDVYFQGQTVVERSLLPAADDLDAANLSELERTYGGELVSSAVARAAVLLFGVAITGGLIFLQLALSRRTRRTLNPALLAASILSFGLTLHSFEALARAQHQLRVAKEDAFTSIHALWQARTAALEAADDENRLLLDPEHAAADAGELAARADALLHLPPGMTPEAALDGGSLDGASGYLVQELRNVTFPGEREAAAAAVTNWEAYQAVMGRVHRLERNGERQQALQLLTGSSEGQGSRSFHQFDRALQRTLDVNQRAFSTAVRTAQRELQHLDLQAEIITVLIAVLVVVGLAARIREYE